MKQRFTLLIISLLITAQYVYSQNCAGGTQLHCSSPQTYAGMVGNTYTNANYDLSGCSGANWTYNGYDRLFYFDAGQVPRNFRIDLTGLAGDLDLLVFRSCNTVNGTTTFSNCVAQTHNGNNTSETVSITNGTGRYYIVVDAFSAHVRSGFTIRVTCNGSSSNPPVGGYNPSGCASATTLTCGSRIWANTPTHNGMNRSDYDFSGCWYGGSGYAFNGRDHLYRIHVGSTRDLTITMSGLSADMDMFLFRSCGTGSYSRKLSNCVAKSIRSGTNSETITVPNASGTYYLAVDSEYNTVSGYDLSVDCSSHQVAGCQAATPLTCGTDRWVNAPTTNHFSGGAYNTSACWSSNYSYTGRDHIYRVDMGSTPRDMRINLSQLTADMDIFLFRSCNSNSHYGGALSNCVAKSVRNGNNSEAIHVPNASGVYYLVVDSHSSSVNSGYRLSLNCNAYSNLGCSNATPLSCGSRKWVNAPTTNNFSGGDYNLSSCWSTSQSYSGNDHLYKITVNNSHNRDLRIKLSGLSADMDLLVFRACENHYGHQRLTQCVDKSIRSGTASEIVTIPNASGTYYIAVDSRSTYSSSGYDIEVDCIRRQSPVACSNATPLACGSSKWVNAPTANNMDRNDYDMSGCWSTNASYNGKDHLYKIDLGNTPRNVQIKMTGLSGDMDMFLFKSCGTSSGYGNAKKLSNCVAKSTNSGHRNEVINLSNASGVYYLAIDSYSAHVSSGYDVSVTCTNPAPVYGCSDAVNLPCGTNNKWVNAPTTNHFSGADYSMSGCWNSSPAYSGKDHLYRINVGPGSKKLHISLTNLSADMDLLLFKSCGSTYNNSRLSNCVAKSTRNGSSDEHIIVENASGVYYLSVDSYNGYSSSGYEISVSCTSPAPVYGCSNAVDLPCGTNNKWVNAPTTNHFSGADYSMSGCWNSNPTYSGKDHLYKINVGSASKKLHISLTNLSADMDLLLFKSCGSTYSSSRLSNCVAKSIKNGSSDEHIIVENASGVYYLSVDSRTSYGSSGYEISVSCTSPAPVYGCSDAVDLPCGTNNKWVNAPTTNHFSGTDYSMSGCWNSSPTYSGKDHLYKINVGSASKKLHISLTNLSSDMDLLLFKSCGAHGGQSRLSNCVAKSTKNGRSNEDIIIENASGVYYLSVDSYNSYGSSGYEISVSCSNPPPPPVSQLCNKAFSLRCGEIFAGSTASTYAFSSDAINSHSGCSYSGGYTGREATHVLHGGQHGLKNISILLENKTSGTNLDIMAYKNCHDQNGYSFSDLIACSQKSNGEKDKIVIPSIAPNESVYIVVDTRVGSTWRDKTANYLLHTQCEPGNYTPPTDCIVITQSNDASYKVDVSKQANMSCINEEVAAYVITDLANQTIDDSSKVLLPIDSNHIAIFNPTKTNLEQHFLVCYTSLCDGDAEACCKTVTVSPRLSCGGTYTGTTVGKASSFDKDDIAACYTSNSSFDGPDQLIRFEKADSNDILQLVLSHTTSNLSLFIFDENLQPAGQVCKGTNYNNSKTLNNSNTIGEVWTDESNPLPAGTYYALIEGYRASMAADFTLYVSCSEINCSTADTITCGQTLTNQTTAGATNTASTYTSGNTSVVAYAGGERRYLFSLSQAQQVTINLDVDTYAGDLDLFLLSSCDPTSVVEYSIDAGDDSITASLSAGTYYIVVDGWNGAEGAYSLSISGCTDPNALAEPVVELRSSHSQIDLHELQVVATPNPFVNTAQLVISSPVADRAQIAYYTTTGAMLHTESHNLNAGENYVELSDQVLHGYTGIILYTIKTSDSFKQGRLLRVE